MPFLTDIPPELIDFLIQIEKKEQKEQENRPFLQIPVPNLTQIPSENSEKSPKNNENDVIVLDI